MKRKFKGPSQNYKKKRKISNDKYDKSLTLVDCPICNKSVLLMNMDIHMDFDCGLQIKNDIKLINKDIKYDFNKYKTLANGFYVIENFINKNESNILLNEINGLKWIYNKNEKRRIQHYGPKLDHNYRVIIGKNDFTKLPQYCNIIGNKILKFYKNGYNIKNKQKINAKNFDQLFINEYKAHDSLRMHFDQRDAFDEIICGLSLMNDSFMTLQHHKNLYEIHKIKLPKLSV